MCEVKRNYFTSLRLVTNLQICEFSDVTAISMARPEVESPPKINFYIFRVSSFLFKLNNLLKAGAILSIHKQ